jgi:hypothetical protein
VGNSRLARNQISSDMKTSLYIMFQYLYVKVCVNSYFRKVELDKEFNTKKGENSTHNDNKRNNNSLWPLPGRINNEWWPYGFVQTNLEKKCNHWVKHQTVKPMPQSQVELIPMAIATCLLCVAGVTGGSNKLPANSMVTTGSRFWLHSTQWIITHWKSLQSKWG